MKSKCNKNLAKFIKYASCTSSIFEPPKILPPGGLRPNEKNNNVYVLLIEVIPRSARLIWRTEK